MGFRKFGKGEVLEPRAEETEILRRAVAKNEENEPSEDEDSEE